VQDKIRVINIGDGDGFLSALIKEAFPRASICLVDLGKTLLFQAHYCIRLHPNASHVLVSESDKGADYSGADFLYCPAEHLDKIDNLNFDLGINISSMQEMNKDSIETYFEFIRRHMNRNNLFYCCNREEKKLIGGEVVNFHSYPWSEQDVYLIDDYCPWYRYFISACKAQNGPRIFNIRIPFIHYFDGAIRHRLSILKTVV